MLIIIVKYDKIALKNLLRCFSGNPSGLLPPDLESRYLYWARISASVTCENENSDCTEIGVVSIICCRKDNEHGGWALATEHKWSLSSSTAKCFVANSDLSDVRPSCSRTFQIKDGSFNDSIFSAKYVSRAKLSLFFNSRRLSRKSFKSSEECLRLACWYRRSRSLHSCFNSGVSHTANGFVIVRVM